MNRSIFDIIKECRNIAMEYTAKARVPECGVFGGIAQDLDYVVNYLEETIEVKEMTSNIIKIVDGKSYIQVPESDTTDNVLPLCDKLRTGDSISGFCSGFVWKECTEQLFSTEQIKKAAEQVGIDRFEIHVLIDTLKIANDPEYKKYLELKAKYEPTST